MRARGASTTCRTAALRGGRVRRALLGLVALIPLIAACSDSGTDPDGGGVFVVAVGNEQFRVRIDNVQLASQARRMMHGLDVQKIVNGELASGDGGYNTGYHWHMKPETVSFADLTIELCDGRPSDIEANLNYWINTVKRFCPWGGRIVAETGSE